MPYIARRRMKHGDGFLEDGDVISDFETWPNTSRLYLLEAGHVEYRPDAAPPAPSAPDTSSAVAAAAEEAGPKPAAPARKSPAKKPAARKPRAKKAP
jgi:hypothetical protein